MHKIKATAIAAIVAAASALGIAAAGMDGGTAHAESVRLAESRSAVNAALSSVEATGGTLEETIEELGRLNSEIDELTEKLAASVRSSYRSSSQPVSSSVLSLLSASSVSELMERAYYGNKIAGGYASSISELNGLKVEAQGKRVLLEKNIADQKAAYEDAARKLDEAVEYEKSAYGRRFSSECHFCQWDPSSRWSSMGYWGGTVAGWGCGLCAYTTAIDALTGASYTPDEMLAIRGDYAGMEKSLSYRSQGEFTLSTFGIGTSYLGGTSTDALREFLTSYDGVAILCSRGRVYHNKEGVWRTSGGHYTCCVGYLVDDETGEGYFAMQDSSYLGDSGTCVRYSENEMAQLLAVADVPVCYFAIE